MSIQPVYDNYEISGCRRFNEDEKDGRQYVEPCDDNEAQFWTLYGHIDGQGVEAIGDFNSRKHAEEVYYRITGQPFGRHKEIESRLRLMHAAPALLEALKLCWQQLSLWVADTESCDLSPEDDEALAKACAAIAQVEGTGITPAPAEIDIHALLAQRRQIAVIWSVEDVQAVHPGLTDDQAWEVLKAADDSHQADIGINWSVLECHAEMLFGDAPVTGKPEEA